MSTRQQRALRGFAAAAFALFVSLFAHVIAGGDPPSPAQVVVPLILATPLSIVLIGIRRSPLALGVAVAASQWIFHTVFSFSSSPLLAAAPTGPHAHHSTDLTLLGAGAAALPADAGMWLSHTLAALLTTLVFWRAETIALHIARLAAFLLRLLFPLFGAEPGPRPALLRPGHSVRSRATRARLGAGVRTLRGPPAGTLAGAG